MSYQRMYDIRATHYILMKLKTCTIFFCKDGSKAIFLAAAKGFDDVVDLLQEYAREVRLRASGLCVCLRVCHDTCPPISLSVCLSAYVGGCLHYASLCVHLCVPFYLFVLLYMCVCSLMHESICECLVCLSICCRRLITSSLLLARSAQFPFLSGIFHLFLL